MSASFLSLLMSAAVVAPTDTIRIPPPRPVDDARAAAAGIRKLVGDHLVLYTDLPASHEVDRLPEVFDQAVPQWAERFNIGLENIADWKMQAYLIQDRAPFDALQLMPKGHDMFRHGFSLGSELWLHEQPTSYYRRHLLLHEGTHGFMANLLGSCGPGWYMEGMAELLATHRLSKNGQLRLRTMPQSRSEVPMWGRIKLINEAVADQRALPLAGVMKIDNRRQLENEAYAWCWGLAWLLDSHPRYRQRFRALQRHVRDVAFDERVRKAFSEDWSDLAIEWQVFVVELCYGFDVQRMSIEFRPGEAVRGEGALATIRADRGWQPSGVWLEAQRSYRINATGRYQIAVTAGQVTGDQAHSETQHQPWPCEPGGVTIQYHGGRPLGILLAAIDDRDRSPNSPPIERAVSFESNGFLLPIQVGLGATITPERSGTLYFRVNDSPARLGDNAGELEVRVEAL